ncbi:hypothetical protein [Amycolatopsis sp. NPDC003676]
MSPSRVDEIARLLDLREVFTPEKTGQTLNANLVPRCQSTTKNF